MLVHEGFAVEQIVRLSEEDNENDEYHTPVPLPEVWASYQRLDDERDAQGKRVWTQERIAAAKGVDRMTVQRRLVYANFPERSYELLRKTNFSKRATPQK